MFTTEEKESKANEEENKAVEAEKLAEVWIEVGETCVGARMTWVEMIEAAGQLH